MSEIETTANKKVIKDRSGFKHKIGIEIKFKMIPKAQKTRTVTSVAIPSLFDNVIAVESCCREKKFVAVVAFSDISYFLFHAYNVAVQRITVFKQETKLFNSYYHTMPCKAVRLT